MSEAKTAGGYIWRIKELEQENLELKARIASAERQYREIAKSVDRLLDTSDAYYEDVKAHDREVAEKVREACVKCVDAESVGAEFNSPLADASNETVDDAITSILNLDLDEVLKDG